MRDDEIRRFLTDANPRWRAAAHGNDPTAWTSSHRLLRDRSRYDLGYRSQVFDDIGTQPVGDDLIVLSGPRRVGKSVALLDLSAQLCRRGDSDARQVIYLPCDGFATRDLRRTLTLGRELTRVVDHVQTTPRIWLLDEITSITGWAAILKAARDGTDFGDDTVIVTGSRWQPGEDIEGQLLAGRAGRSPGRRVRHLLPLTFRDFVAVTRPELARPDAVHPADLQSHHVAHSLEALRFDVDAYDLAWQDFLTCGGFPRAVAEHTRNGAVSEAYIRDLAAWLHRDASPDSPPESLPLLLDKVATRMASPLSIRATAEEMSVDRRAATTWLNRLVAAFAALWCPQHEDGRPVEGAQSKVYLTDPLLAWLPSVLRSGLATPDMTVLTEAAIAVTLARAIDNLDEGRWVAGDTIGYVRTGSGKEVDLGPVRVPTPTGPGLTAPLEGKWVDAGWRSEAQVVERRFDSGILATKSILDTNTPTWAVPAPLLALLLI